MHKPINVGNSFIPRILLYRLYNACMESLQLLVPYIYHLAFGGIFRTKTSSKRKANLDISFKMGKRRKTKKKTRRYDSGKPIRYSERTLPPTWNQICSPFCEKRSQYTTRYTFSHVRSFYLTSLFSFISVYFYVWTTSILHTYLSTFYVD